MTLEQTDKKVKKYGWVGYVVAYLVGFMFSYFLIGFHPLSDIVNTATEQWNTEQIVLWFLGYNPFPMVMPEITYAPELLTCAILGGLGLYIGIKLKNVTTILISLGVVTAPLILASIGAIIPYLPSSF